MYFSGGTHSADARMLMSGSWHIYRPGETWRLLRRAVARRCLATEQIRRGRVQHSGRGVSYGRKVASCEGIFGVGPSRARHDSIIRRAPAGSLLNARMEIGERTPHASRSSPVSATYISQKICFACGVHPFRKVASLSPNELSCLLATARKFMSANVTDWFQWSNRDLPRTAAHHRARKSGRTTLGLSQNGRALPPLRHADSIAQARF